MCPLVDLFPPLYPVPIYIRSTVGMVADVSVRTPVVLDAKAQSFNLYANAIGEKSFDGEDSDVEAKCPIPDSTNAPPLFDVLIPSYNAM